MPHLFSWPGDVGYVASVNLSSITFSDTNVSPAPLGVSGATLTLRDTAQARFNAPASTPTNQTALDALARQLFQDWCDWRSQSFDLVYNGVVNPLPNALIDVAEFCYTADDQWTRVQSAVWSGEPVEYAHFDPTIADPACQQSWDRGPFALFFGPGASASSGATTLIREVLGLEGGRLVGAYDSNETVNCGCAPPSPPSCAKVCVPVVGCSSNPVSWATVTLSKTGFSETQNATTFVSGFTMVFLGSGYLATPTIFISGGGGSGASAIPIVSGGSVVSAFLASGGSNFTGNPAISISGGGGSGATATIFLVPTTVNTVTLINGGSNYTGLPGITFTTPTGQTGSGATAAASMGVFAIASIASGGTGYSAGDFLTVSGGTASTAAVLRVSTVASGVITSVTITTQGNYTALPPIPASVTGGTGNGATFDLLWHILSIAVTGHGSNYSAAPAVGFSGGGGSGAVANANLVATSVASVAITSGGSLYNNNPVVTISDSAGGSGALAVATVSGGQVTLVATAGGSGYSNPATVTVTIAHPPSGTPAQALATLTSQACFAVPSSGLYTASVVASRYANGSTTITVPSCTGNPTVTGSPVGLVADSTHVCCTFFYKPIARTLFLTAPDGNFTLTYSNTTGEWTTTPGFHASGSFTTANGPPDANAPVTCSSTTTGPIDIGYLFNCNFSRTDQSFRLSYLYFLVECCVWLPPAFLPTHYYAPSGATYRLNNGFMQAETALASALAVDAGSLSWTYPSLDNTDVICGPTLIPYTGPFIISE